MSKQMNHLMDNFFSIQTVYQNFAVVKK